MADSPLNANDTIATGNPNGIVTINPGDKITNDVQYYRTGPTGQTYQNSQNPVFRYTTPAPIAAPATPATPDAPTVAPVDENSIRKSVADSMQSQIDAINANYSNLISQENVNGQDRSGQTRAINARSGILGSDFGNSAQQKTTDFNTQQVKGLEDQQASQIAAVQANIEDRASQAIESARTNALNKYNVDESTYERNQAAARGDLQSLAQGGVDLATLSPDQKAALYKQAGYSDNTLGDLVYNAMKPRASQIDYQYINQKDGSVLAVGVDPKTGKLTSQVIPGASPDVGIVLDMISKYPDAGIKPTDDLAAATQKIHSNSALYRKDTYIAPTTANQPSDSEVHTAAFNGYDQIFQQGSKSDNLLANGQDGYANPTTYNKLRNDAVSKGYDANQFDSQFKSYVNPSDPWDYQGQGGKK